MMKTVQAYYYHIFPGEEYAYGFITDAEIEYQIMFRPIPFLFPDIPELVEQVFELSIIPIPNPANVKPKADARIHQTITEMLKEFFLHLPDNVTLYMPDSSDNRHLIRQRLFSSWFGSSEDKRQYIKIDVVLDENQPGDIAFTLLMRKGNSCVDRVLQSIEQLKNDFRQGS